MRSNPARGKEDIQRRVLARLELVTDDRHLALEDFLLEEGVGHAIGFEVEGPGQVIVRDRNYLVIVG
jgi:hypothetical protein